jgi:hypothetical protein
VLWPYRSHCAICRLIFQQKSLCNGSWKLGPLPYEAKKSGSPSHYSPVSQHQMVRVFSCIPLLSNSAQSPSMRRIQSWVSRKATPVCVRPSTAGSNPVRFNPWPSHCFECVTFRRPCITVCQYNDRVSQYVSIVTVHHRMSV